MAKVVIISHPSEVIRNGLLSILENEISSKIICIEKYNELKEHYFINYSEMVLLFPFEENHMELFKILQGRSNQIILIAVKLSDSRKKTEHIDYIYNINTPAELNQFLASQDNNP